MTSWLLFVAVGYGILLNGGDFGLGFENTITHLARAGSNCIFKIPFLRRQNFPALSRVLSVKGRLEYSRQRTTNHPGQAIRRMPAPLHFHYSSKFTTSLDSIARM